MMHRVISLESLLILLSAFYYLASVQGREIEGEGSYPEFHEEMQLSPIDVNRAMMEDLIKLPGVSPSIASGILEARTKVGRFRSKRDLLEIGSVSEELYDMIAPYITITGQRVEREEEVSMRMRGFGKWSTENEKPGEWGNYLRVMWRRGERWKAGIVADRDPGESGFIDNWKWALSYGRKTGFVEKVVAGNLRYELSRGILFFTRSRVSKGSLVPGSLGRKGRGVGADLSTTEGYVLRGFGVRMRLCDPVALTVLVSSTPLDVSRDESGKATSVRSSGYHPPSFTGDRNGLKLFTSAGHIDAKLGVLGNLGFTLADLKYSELLRPPLDQGNYYWFRGSRRSYVGFDWDLLISDLGFFGEVGHELQRGGGFQVGVEMGTGPTRWSILFRDYSSDFQPPFGNPIQDGSGPPANERGFFSSLGFKITPDLRMSLYVDAYRRTWRRVREPFPSERSETFVEGRWRPGRGVWLIFRASERRGDRAVTVDYLPKNRKNLRRSLRLQMEWGDKPVKMRGRYERAISAWSETSVDSGDLLYFDTRFRPNGSFSFDLRVMFFGSETISSAVYEYETDLPGVMRIIPLTGEGMRWYFNVKWQAGRDWSISAKYGETNKYSDDNIEYNAGKDIAQRSFGVQLDIKTTR
jgi:hypothetical protein